MHPCKRNISRAKRGPWGFRLSVQTAKRRFWALKFFWGIANIHGRYLLRGSYWESLWEVVAYSKIINNRCITKWFFRSPNIINDLKWLDRTFYRFQFSLILFSQRVKKLYFLRMKKGGVVGSLPAKTRKRWDVRYDVLADHTFSRFIRPGHLCHCDKASG